jgi:hypothetical protein
MSWEWRNNGRYSREWRNSGRSELRMKEQWPIWVENEGTFTDKGWEWRNIGQSPHTEWNIVYAEWRILILSFINFSTLKYREKRLKLCAFSLIAKLLTIILLDIISCDRDGMKAEISMCYVPSEFPRFLNYWSHMFTFVYFEWSFQKYLRMSWFKTLRGNWRCSKGNFKLRKLKLEQFKIIYLKDSRGEPHTLKVLLSCCY